MEGSVEHQCYDRKNAKKKLLYTTSLPNHKQAQGIQ